MNDIAHIFTILFLMLGPFKIIGPFQEITAATDPSLSRQIAIRAILYSTAALLVAGLAGQNLLVKFGIPVPILALSGGIILFMVALSSVTGQFKIRKGNKEVNVQPATMKMAINPLAFPTIVTPYGIAAVIVFLALRPELEDKMRIGAVVLIIMAVNLLFMIYVKGLIKILAFILPLLAAILGVIQVALGLQIIYKSLNEIFKWS